jgi:hypothetical protein
MIGPAPHTADDIYCMYLQLNQAIWKWARRTGKYKANWYILDSHIIVMMHQYAYTVRDYLIGCGIATTYDEAWGAKDNRIYLYLSSTGTWWRVNRYYLDLSILEPCTPDIWVGLNSKHAVWSDIDTMYEACCTVDEVVSTVQGMMNWVRAQAQCSGCHYSEGAGTVTDPWEGGDYMEGEGVQYCGLGRELMLHCKDYIGRGSYAGT